jgi:hypothetical protein
MKINKILVGTMCALIGSIPFVAADVIPAFSKTTIYVALVVAAIVIIGFVVGAIFLIRWIIRRIRSKGNNVEMKK